MDIDMLQEQLEQASDEETKENVENTFKVADAMDRRFKGMENSDFLEDEIIIGTAISLNKLLNKVDSDRKDRLKAITERILKM
jgi:hypothetical protein